MTHLKSVTQPVSKSALKLALQFDQLLRSKPNAPNAPNAPSAKSLTGQQQPVSPGKPLCSIPERPRQAIALISDHADPAAVIGHEEAGGQNVYVRQVGEALAQLGWQVDMFTRRVDPQAPSIVQHGPHCRTIRLKAGPECFIPRDELFPYMGEFVESFRAFQTQQGLQYPLVHTNYWLSAWVGLQLRRHQSLQILHTYHSLGSVKYRTLAKRPPIADIRLQVEQQILVEADCIIATSTQERDLLRQMVAQTGQIEVIPCGTDIRRFSSQPKSLARRQLGWSSTERILLYVGRLDPRKGLETLLRASAQLEAGSPVLSSPWRLVIVGGSSPDRSDGQERQRLEQLAQDLGISDRITFAGAISHDELPNYYNAADICIIPSHYEPFGLVAIEAMACGTPVVASDVGGLRFTVIPEETGLLVPPCNPAALAEAIGRILTDEILAQKLRQQSSFHVQQRFSWSKVAMQLSTLYRYTLARSIMHEHPWNPQIV
jgi:D-inositol-3-phosphate glycosyltransferase